MTTYCAPCITELALVREATTAVAGSASCTAHAVLLAHPDDLPGRRRQRLGELRKLAEAKRENASPEEQAHLELLLHEYTLAGAMDMSAPGRQQGQQQGGRGQARGPEGEGGERGPRPGKSRRGRGRGEGGEGGPREGGPRGEGGRPAGAEGLRQHRCGSGRARRRSGRRARWRERPRGCLDPRSRQPALRGTGVRADRRAARSAPAGAPGSGTASAPETSDQQCPERPRQRSGRHQREPARAGRGGSGRLGAHPVVLHRVGRARGAHAGLTPVARFPEHGAGRWGSLRVPTRYMAPGPKSVPTRDTPP